MATERQLSGVLSEFARTMVTDFPIQGILDRLVQRIVEILPVTGAGVTLIGPRTGPRYVAASDELALHYEQLQSELGEGPCLAAYRTGEAVAVADLRTDSRFAVFGPRAVEVGLVAVFTFPALGHLLGLNTSMPAPLPALLARLGRTWPPLITQRWSPVGLTATWRIGPDSGESILSRVAR